MCVCVRVGVCGSVCEGVGVCECVCCKYRAEKRAHTPAEGHTTTHEEEEMEEHKGHTPAQAPRPVHARQQQRQRRFQ